MSTDHLLLGSDKDSGLTVQIGIAGSGQLLLWTATL